MSLDKPRLAYPRKSLTSKFPLCLMGIHRTSHSLPTRPSCLCSLLSLQAMQPNVYTFTTYADQLSSIDVISAMPSHSQYSDSRHTLTSPSLCPSFTLSLSHTHVALPPGLFLWRYCYQS